MKLGEVLLGVPVYPDIGRHVEVGDEEEVNQPPDLEDSVHSELVIEYLEDQVQSLVTGGWRGESFSKKYFKEILETRVTSKKSYCLNLFPRRMAAHVRQL